MRYRSPLNRTRVQHGDWQLEQHRRDREQLDRLAADASATEAARKANDVPDVLNTQQTEAERRAELLAAMGG